MENSESENTSGKYIIKQLINAENGIVSNVSQKVIIGNYERIKDAYIYPESIFNEHKTENFIGRKWLIDEIDAFISKNDSGSFLIEADAGIGKTAFLAHLVKQRNYIHYFIKQGFGTPGIESGVRSLVAQLILAWKINPYYEDDVIPSSATRPEFLQNIINLAAASRNKINPNEKIIIVIDALDEARGDYYPNVIGLPRVLPKGVYVIASQRPVQANFWIEGPRQVFRLKPKAPDNLADAQHYLESVILNSRLREKIKDEKILNHLISTLLEKSGGVWIYLKFIITEIEKGERSIFDLNSLPLGIWQYYAQYCQTWRSDEYNWDSLYLPMLSCLAVAQESISAEDILNWTGIDRHVKEVNRILSEKWRPYITVEIIDGKKLFSFYHSSFRDFILGKVKNAHFQTNEIELIDELSEAAKDANRLVADYYLKAWGGLEQNLPGLNCIENGDTNPNYGLRYLVHHLLLANRNDEINKIMTFELKAGNRYENAWYSIKEKNNDIEGYLNDLRKIISSLSLNQIVDFIRYSLYQTSVNSLGKNIPSDLLVLLVKNNVWSLSQSLTYARNNPDIFEKVFAYLKLFELMPLKDRKPLLSEIRSTVVEIIGQTDINFDKNILLNEAPNLLGYISFRLQDILKETSSSFQQQFSSIVTLQESEQSEGYEILNARKNDLERLQKSAQNYLNLSNELRTFIITVNIDEYKSGQLTLEGFANLVGDEMLLGGAFVKLMPHIKEADLPKVLEIAEILDDFLKISIFSSAIGIMHGKDQEILVEQVLKLIEEEQDHYSKIVALANLVTRVPETYKDRLVEKVLDGMDEVSINNFPAILVNLAPLMIDEQKEKLLKRIVRNSRSEFITVFLVNTLANYATNAEKKENLLKYSLSTAKGIEDEGKRSQSLSCFCIVNQLPQFIIDEILSELGKLKDKFLYVEGMCQFISVLDSEKQKEVLLDCVSVVRRIQDSEPSLLLLAQLNLSAKDESKRNTLESMALELMGTEGDWFTRDSRIIRLVKQLMNVNLINLALDFVDQVQNTFEQANLLIELLPLLPKKEYENIIGRIIQSVYKLNQRRDGDKTLHKLIVTLFQIGEVSKGYELLSQIDSEPVFVDLVERLLPNLSGSDLDQMLRLVDRMQGLISRAEILSVLSSHYDEPTKSSLLKKAKDLALMINGEVILERGGMQWSIRRVDAIVFKIDALSTIYRYTQNEKEKDELKKLALENLKFVASDDQGYALLNIAPLLTNQEQENLIGEFLIGKNSLGRASYNRDILIDLIRLLPKGLQESVSEHMLEEICSSGSDESYNDVFFIIPFLPFNQSIIKRVGEVIKNAKTSRDKNYLLAQMSIRYAKEDIWEAIKLIKAVQEESARSYAITTMLSVIEKDWYQINELTEWALELKNRNYRSEAITAICQSLKEMPQNEQMLVVNGMMKRLLKQTRSDWFLDMVDIYSVVRTFLSKDQEEIIFCDITNAARWWG